MGSILRALKERFEQFGEDTAQAIAESNWSRLSKNIAMVSIILVGLFAILCLILVGIWKIMSAFLGKVLMGLFGAPLLLYVLIRSYQMNTEDEKKQHRLKDAKNHVEVWAEDIYEYVRNAMFLVFRSLSAYTSIIMPTSPSMIELPNGISIKDGYAVFTFFARVRDTIDVGQFKRDLSTTLTQMLRAHELQGIPSDLVQINGSYYAPLQVLDVVDMGDSVTVSIAFADEKTVEIAKARKLLHLELARKNRHIGKEDPCDDEL